MPSGFINRDLLQAYLLLFRPPHPPPGDFLERLRLSVLSSAYKKRAMETHPDRARIIGKCEDELNEGFKKVARAYETLKAALSGGPFDTPLETAQARGSRPDAPDVQCNTSGGRHFYQGRLPNRPLLLGQYLYYSKLISWESLIQAIIIQKRRRPLIGQIATGWKILSPQDVRRILLARSAEQKQQQRFAEYALQKGWITPFERLALIGQQKRLQGLFGNYFIEKGVLSERELCRLVEALNRHNRRVLTGY